MTISFISVKSSEKLSDIVKIFGLGKHLVNNSKVAEVDLVYDVDAPKVDFAFLFKKLLSSWMLF